LVAQHYVRDAGGFVDEECIYPFYVDVAERGGPPLRQWAKFATFCLLLATGNAISERGFSAMAAVHNKSRSELGLEQVLAPLLAQFNGKAYGAFFEEIDRDSKREGKKWWGYVEKRGENLSRATGEPLLEVPATVTVPQDQPTDRTGGGTRASAEYAYALLSSGMC